MNELPQVIHIGFSKCASTYLRALFRGHEGIHLVFKSGFFTPFLAKGMTFRDYQHLFVGDRGILNVESDEHLTLPGVHPELGVRTTNLVEFAEVADKIRTYLPNVRIIMVIRNQASLIASRYSEFLITGGSLDFEEFADALLGEKSGTNHYFQNYYFEIINILQARFPREQLLVLLQEAMREDTRRTAAQISRFMSLKDDLELKEGLRSERRSLSYYGMKFLSRLNGYLVRRPSIGGAPPTTRVPLSIFRNAVKIVRALDYYALARISPDSARVLTPERRRRILAHFREDNLKLQAHFGRSLVELGYFGEESRGPTFPSS